MNGKTKTTGTVNKTYQCVCLLVIARQQTDARYCYSKSVCLSVRPSVRLSVRLSVEQPQTHISRSGHSLTLNISEMAKDTAIVTIEGE